MSDSLEALEAAMHGDGPCGLGVICATPGTEAGDDPGGPGQGSWWVGVGQALGLAVDSGGEGFENVDVVRLEGGGGGPVVGAPAGVDELHADDGGAQGDEGQLAQDARDGDLAVLDAEALALQRPEELLDVPAASVVGNGLMSGREALDGALDRSRQ